MPKIEVIYLRHKKTENIYVDTNQQEKDNYIEEKNKEDALISQVTIHTKHKKEETAITKNINLKNKIIKEKNYKRIFSIFTVAIIFMTTAGFIALDTGYLPVKAFLSVREPVGTVGSIDLDNFVEKYQEISNIPDIKDLKYKIYISEATPENVIENYRYQLEQEGYKLNYKGIITKRGINFHYYGFVEGITAVGLLITDEINELLGEKTTILYTTGSIFDYDDIISFYKENSS